MDDMIDSWLFNAVQAEVAYRDEQLHATRRNIANRRRFRRRRAEDPAAGGQEPAAQPTQGQAQERDREQAAQQAQPSALSRSEPEPEHAAANWSGKESVR